MTSTGSGCSENPRWMLSLIRTEIHALERARIGITVSSEFPSPKQRNKQHINRTNNGINAMKAPPFKQ